MPLDDVLDDRQPQSLSADRTRPSWIDSIESLGQPGEMLGRNSLPLILYRQPHHRRAVAPQTDFDRRARPPIFDRVADQIVQKLEKLIPVAGNRRQPRLGVRSEEHTSELQSLMRISYAVFCLKKK